LLVYSHIKDDFRSWQASKSYLFRERTHLLQWDQKHRPNTNVSRNFQARYSVSYGSWQPGLSSHSWL
jgi:hypothetical protein